MRAVFESARRRRRRGEVARHVESLQHGARDVRRAEEQQSPRMVARAPRRKRVARSWPRREGQTADSGAECELREKVMAEKKQSRQDGDGAPDPQRRPQAGRSRRRRCAASASARSAAQRTLEDTPPVRGMIRRGRSTSSRSSKKAKQVMKLNQICRQSGRAQAQRQASAAAPARAWARPSGRGVKGAKARTGDADAWLRRRPDAAAHAHARSAASATFSRTDFAEVNLGPHPEGDRRQAARRPARRSPMTMLRKAGLASERARRRAPARARASSRPRSRFEVAGASGSAIEAVEKAGGSRHHDLQEDGLHEQEGRTRQARQTSTSGRGKARQAAARLVQSRPAPSPLGEASPRPYQNDAPGVGSRE